MRREILLPLKGDLVIFVEPIQEYLSLLDDQEGPEDCELFPIRYQRAWEIINHITEEMSHYLRDMG